MRGAKEDVRSTVDYGSWRLNAQAALAPRGVTKRDFPGHAMHLYSSLAFPLRHTGETMRFTATLLSTILLAAPSFASLAAPLVPLAAFVHEDKFSNPRLSPDGKHLMITVRLPDGDRDVPVLMTFSLPGMQNVGAIRLPKFVVPLDYHWITNTRLAIEKGTERGSIEAPVSNGEVLAVDMDGSKPEYLYGHDMFRSSSRGDRYGDDYGYGEIEGIPRARNGHLYLASHPWEGARSLLYDIDSRNASRKLMANLPNPDLDFLIQNNGKMRYAFGHDDQYEALLFRHDDATDNWTRLSGLGRRYHPLRFSMDDKQMLVDWSPHGGPDKLVREDVETGKRVTLFEDAVGSYGSVLFGPDRNMPFGAFSAVGMPQVRYFDENDPGARLHKLLSAQFPGQTLRFIDFSDDGNTLLFSVASDRDPGSYYLFDRKAMKADLLLSSREEIDPEQMAPRRPISFKARDGLVLHGFLTMPAHPARTKVPLLLLPHGGPFDIADDWYFDTDAQFLASRGYAVLQVNYRGSGGRGPDFRDTGYRQWGGKIQDDLVDGVRWAVATGEVDGARMCAYGASFGGYSALMLAAREPLLFKCVVGYAGVYDLSLVHKPQNNRWDDATANYFRKTVGADKAELDRYSPALLADRITAPVMLVHGGQDKRAVVENAEKMRDALIKAGRPPEWFLAPGEGHGFYTIKNRTEFYQRLEAFLAKHLGQ
jgi:dipeptidyl aminopeptidase/acylaminoacyl peptidase